MSEYKLVVSELKVPVIKFNFDEVMSKLDETVSKYENIIVTEDTVKGNKKILAELNSAKKEIETFRKKVKKEANKPVKEAEEKCKQLVARIDEAYDPIKEQMENWIESERVKKKENVELVKIQTQEEIQLKPEYLARVEIKDKYLNSSESLNKVKVDMVQQFQTLKLEQDLEQQKIDTVNTIIEAYNDSLEFKFNASNFSHLMNEDVATISATVKQMVLKRKEDEKAKKEQIEIEKQEAIKAAELKVKEDARLEAERVERERIAEEQRVEREHQAELKRIENERIAAEKRIREEAQAEAIRTTETIVESVSKFVPVEAKEEEPLLTITMKLKATNDQFTALKEYVKASGVKAKFKIEL